MGPRKKLASKGKRTAEPVSTERRTKFRHDPAHTVSPPDSMPQAISTMGNRAVTSGRKIELDFLDREGFKIAEWIRRQHWERFCTLNLPYYPSLVRNFFENLRLGHGSVSSTVKGTLIVLNEEKLSRMLAIPNTGKCFMLLEKKEEALKTVLEKETITDLSSLLAGQLSVEVRLLHNIISRVFLPKTGRFDWVSEKEIIFMHYLMKGEPINLPYLMLTQIKEAAKGKRSCLPYGMVFTLIFSESGINLENEIAKKLLHTDTYNDKSLIRMGYIKKDNIWKKKIDNQKESDTEDEEEDEEEEEETEGSAPTAAETALPEAPGHEEEETPVETTAVPQVDQPTSSQAAPSTSSAQQFVGVSADQIAQLSEVLKSELRSLVGEVREDISKTQQQITQSYQELRSDIRDLTLRVEILEQKQRSQDSLHGEIIELRSDFGRMRGAADKFAQDQDQITSAIQKDLKEIKVGIESTLICLLGSNNPFSGGSTSSRPPPPQPTPRPPPHATYRPPFTSSVRPGTGFPEPSTRTGVTPKTRSSRQKPSRSSKIHAPYSVKVNDSDSESSD